MVSDPSDPSDLSNPADPAEEFAESAACFTSRGSAGDLTGRFQADLSLALDAFGAALLCGGAYPGRLNGEPPVRAGPDRASRRESHEVADFAEGAARATYADGTVAVHRRTVLFKHGDYWIVLDRISVGGGPDKRRIGVAFDIPSSAGAPDPVHLRLITGDPDAGGARLAVFPMMGPGLTGSIESCEGGSRFVLERPARGEATFATLLLPVAPGDEPSVERVEGIEAEGALALRIFFLDGWVHTFVDKGESRDLLTLNWLPIRAEITLLEIMPLGDLSRRIEFGHRDSSQ